MGKCVVIDQLSLKVAFILAGSEPRSYQNKSFLSVI